MKTADRIKPAQFLMADGQTTLEAKVRRYAKHIRDRAKTWGGTQQEYEQWAERSLKMFLHNIADQTYMMCETETNPEPRPVH
jgi:L-serine deaminase